MIEQEDSGFIERFRKGDPEIYERLVRKYHRVVYNVAYRITGDAIAAEDVTQVVFTRMFEHASGYDPKYKLFSWMYRIAVNESINHRNQARRDEKLEDDIGDGSRNPEEILQQNETCRSVQSALAAMKSEYRVVIVLKHFNDLSYEEIAGVLSIPEKTVKSRLFTARQQLRDILLKNRLL